MLFILPVLAVIVLVVPALFIIIFPVPETALLKVIAPVVPVLAIVKLLPLSATAPLKTTVDTVDDKFPIVRVPTELVPKLTGLETVKPPFINRDAEPPLELPSVIA